MDKAEKKIAVDRLKEQFEKSQTFFLTDFRGIKVDKIQSIRREIKSVDGNFQVTKNTLTRLAMKEVGCEELADHLQEQNAIAFAYSDPSPVAKVIKKYLRGEEEAGLEFRVGRMGDQIIEKEVSISTEQR